MDHKFKIGDRVRIRTVEDMLNEFGETAYDWTPKVRAGWHADGGMDKLCGRTATISRYNYGEIFVCLDDWSDSSDTERWAFSVDMLEPAVESPSQKCERLAQSAKNKAAREKAERSAQRKQAREEKAKAAKRDKARKGLPAPAKRALLYLDANKDAFGCQRAHVLGIVAALTGVHIDRIKKAYDA